VEKPPEGLRTALARWSSCGERVPDRLRPDVEDGDAPPLELDDRDQLAVAALELGVAADVDRAELEAELAAQLLERAQGLLAEVAALGVEDDELARYG
jgi:hypothetical protein